MTNSSDSARGSYDRAVRITSRKPIAAMASGHPGDRSRCKTTIGMLMALYIVVIRDPRSDGASADATEGKGG
jgi:hypothetical protein